MKASLSSNEMYSLAIEGTELGALKASWSRIEFRDPLPSLNSHMCVLYKDDFLLLIGGESKRDEILDPEMPAEETEEDGLINTVYMLDLKTKRVNTLPQENNEFKPRMAHSGVAYKDNIYIFGGLEKSKLFNNQYLRLTVKQKQEDTSEKMKEEEIEPKEEPKSPQSESKHVARCKFCPGRALSKAVNYLAASMNKATWPDLSALEIKMKRRLT